LPWVWTTFTTTTKNTYPKLLDIYNEKLLFLWPTLQAITKTIQTNNSKQGLDLSIAYAERETEREREHLDNT